MSFTMHSNQRRNSMQAFGLAILIEVAIVVVAGVILISNTQVKPAISEPVPITLTDLPLEEKPPEPVPRQPQPPQPKVKAVVKPNLPKLQTPVQPQETPPVALVPPTEIAAAPTAFTQPAPPPPSPPPAISGKVDAKASYAAKVYIAVLAAHRQNYPAAAVLIRFNGKTQVEFHLQDGNLIGEPRILVSCGNGIFDKSALQALLVARYPMPPEELRGDNTKMTVWVHFDEH
jgi:outer membrane biosynthesis protein TonB